MMVKKHMLHSCYCLLATCLLQGSLTAQDLAGNIAGKLNTYRSVNVGEKLFVHTDKNFYIAGEIIWFKVYATDALLQQPLDLSKISYVEVLNAEHKPILQAKIAMNQASGNGSFQLPYSVNSGNYTLRAYTNWMKNAGAELFFEKNITIVNALKQPDWPAVNGMQYDIQFFPEGGNLVSDLGSVVGFKITDKQGKGQSVTVAVINQRNKDTVARFQTNRFGMGHFSLKPYGNDQYVGVMDIQGNKVFAELSPAALSQGITMQVKNKDAQTIVVHLEGNTGVAAVTLLVSNHQSVKKVFTQDLLNGETDIIVDKSYLGDGISQLTVFNGSVKPVCERLYFKRPPLLSVSVQPDAQEYAARKKVALTINTKNTAQEAIPGDLSAAVYLLDSLQTPDMEDIAAYLWLQSDLKGNIESPGYYFSDHADAVQAADDLMLTQGWRRFKWNDVMEPANKMAEYVPEIEGHLITGKLVDKRNGQPTSDITAYLSVPREKSLFSVATSSKNGAIRFNVKDLYGGNEIVVQTNSGNADSNYRVDIATPFWEKYSISKPPPFNLSASQAGLLLQHSMQAQLANTFAGDKQRRFLYPQAIDTTSFYGISDKRYYLDDYTRFITMEEVMREFVAEVRVRKSNDQFTFRALNKAYEDFFDTPPLVLMDGVPVFDATKIIQFDPLKVRRIDVVAHKFYQNQFIHDGIIQYHTYQGDLAGYQLDANALVVEYEGLQLQREFYSPIYETTAQQQSRLPDPRNLLYWSPDVRTDKAGNKKITFYTSDTPGRYLVFVQGIATNGLAGSATTFFKVTP